MWCNELTLQDIMIDGYGHGRAMLLKGNRIRVFRPTIVHPDIPTLIDPSTDDAGGIRHTGGEGFRCYDGYVESGGDAAYQFSTQRGSGKIIDGAYIGCRGKSLTGRFLLAGTKFDEIRHVRFEGISGESGGECVKVQNALRTDTNDPIAPISDVVFSDVEVTSTAGATESVVVLNELPATQPAGTVTNIRFENFVVRTPVNVALQVIGGDNGVDGLEWRGGGVHAPSLTAPAIRLSGLRNGRFEALSIPLQAGTSHHAVVVGDSPGNGACANVVLADMMVSGVASGKSGVEFKYAVNCGWLRGGVAGVSGAKAVSITGFAQACYFEGANVSGIPTEPKIDVPLTGGHRIANNYGGTQRTPLSLGVQTSVAILNNRSITVTSTSVAVSNYLGAATGNLDTINGGQDGDVLVLRAASAAQVVTVRDNVGGNLALAGNFPLDTLDDTLILTRTAAGWLELSRSDNTVPP